MKTKILSGKEVSASVYSDIKSRIDTLRSREITPNLSVLLVGNNPASEVYVNSKSKRFSKLGLLSETIKLPEDISQDHLISKIEELNEDNKIHGILVQLPLPKHIDTDSIIKAIKPQKTRACINHGINRCPKTFFCRINSLNTLINLELTLLN